MRYRIGGPVINEQNLFFPHAEKVKTACKFDIVDDIVIKMLNILLFRRTLPIKVYFVLVGENISIQDFEKVIRDEKRVGALIIARPEIAFTAIASQDVVPLLTSVMDRTSFKVRFLSDPINKYDIVWSFDSHSSQLVHDKKRNELSSGEIIPCVNI